MAERSFWRIQNGSGVRSILSWMLLGTHDATFLWRHHEPLVDSRSRLICPGGKSRPGRPLDWSWHGRVTDRLGIMDLCCLVNSSVVRLLDYRRDYRVYLFHLTIYCLAFWCFCVVQEPQHFFCLGFFTYGIKKTIYVSEHHSIERNDNGSDLFGSNVKCSCLGSF